MARDYQPGDLVFFSTSNNTVAGEGMFIGRLKDSPEDLVLVIGQQVVEMWEKYCTPLRRGFPAEGRAWRAAYQKAKPGALAPA
jgi:hypothetical protein